MNKPSITALALSLLSRRARPCPAQAQFEPGMMPPAAAPNIEGFTVAGKG